MVCTEQTLEPLNLNEVSTKTSTAAWDGPRTGEGPRSSIVFANRSRVVHVAPRADLYHKVEAEALDGHSGNHVLDPRHPQVVQLKLRRT